MTASKSAISIARKSVIVVLVLYICQSGAGTIPQLNAQTAVNSTFYVSPLGNDSNPGSSSQPWLTIQKAADTLLPGESVIVMPGTYLERVRVTRSGTAGAPITFQANGAVTMQGFTILANYITVRGFSITDTPDNGPDGMGVYVKGSNCIIADNYIYYATRGGIFLDITPGNETATNNCIVRNNRLYRNAMSGIEVHGVNHLIEGNEVWGTIQYHPKWINPPDWVDADGMHFFGSGHTFKSNYIHDIHYGIPENPNPHIDCFQTWPESQGTHDVVFERNTCTNIDAQSPYEVGQGFMLNGTRDLTLRNNVIQAYRNINGTNNTNLSIVNNILSGVLSVTTAYNPAGVSLETSTYTTIKNNAFYNLPGHSIVLDSTSRQGWDVGYNSIYRSDRQAPLDPPNPYDLWGIDPAFVDPASANFHLLPSSPLINSGVMRSDVPDDFYGTARPQGAAFDIGIHEYFSEHKIATRCCAKFGDSVTFEIAFLSTGNTIWITDTLPLEFAYLSSNSSCQGSTSYNANTRQLTYSGTHPVGNNCTVRIITQVETDARSMVTNTALFNSGQTSVKSLSAWVLLNGMEYYIPFITKHSWLWGWTASKNESSPNQIRLDMRPS